MASLTVQSEGGEEKFSVDSPSVTLGRGLECDIRIKDIKSSRRHCQVLRSSEGYKLVDLGSGNGTYVNGILVNREHKLREGDAIQIGECVIVFSGGDAGARPPNGAKSVSELEKKQAATATSRTPAVPGSATSRTTAKMANTAVTKKSPTSATNATARKTDKMPAASTSRTAAPPTAGATTRRGKTDSIPTAPERNTTKRGGTAKVPTARGQTQKTTRATMVDKFKTEAGKKKTNPMVFVIAGGAVVVIAIVVCIILFTGGGNDLEFDRSRIKDLTAKAAKSADADRFDEAVASYTEAIKICEKHPELSQQKEQLKSAINDVTNFRKDREEALAQWKTLHKDYTDGKYSEVDGGIKELRDKVSLAKKNHEILQRPWAKKGAPCMFDGDACKVRPKEDLLKVSEVERMLEVLELQLKEESATKRREGLQAKRNEINRKFLKQDHEDFGGAVRAWEEYIGSTRDEEGKRKGPEERDKIFRLAQESFERLRKKANNMEKKEGAEFLRGQQDRFVGCKGNNDQGQAVDLEEEFKKAIAQLEKE